MVFMRKNRPLSILVFGLFISPLVGLIMALIIFVIKWLLYDEPFTLKLFPPLMLLSITLTIYLALENWIHGHQIERKLKDKALQEHEP